MKTLQSLVTVATLAGLLTGCQDQGSRDGDEAAKEKLRLVFIANTSSEYWSMVEVGGHFSARQLGNVEFDFRFPAERTVDAQEALINSFVADDVDGIAVSPIDANQQIDFLNGVAEKTLLVCADSDAQESKRLSYIGTDNVAAGRQAGELLKAALPQGGKVILFVGYPNAQNTKDRVQGIQEVLAGSGIEIIDTMVDQHKSPIAQKNAVDSLVQHPDVTGMIGIYSYHGPAILTAVRSAGKAGTVKIVCFDEDNETLDGIVAGDVFGTIVQRPLVIGATAIRRMGLYLRGETEQLAENKIFIPSQAITTKEGVERFKSVRHSMLQPDPEI